MGEKLSINGNTQGKEEETMATTRYEVIWYCYITPDNYDTYDIMERVGPFDSIDEAKEYASKQAEINRTTSANMYNDDYGEDNNGGDFYEIEPIGEERIDYAYITEKEFYKRFGDLDIRRMHDRKFGHDRLEKEPADFNYGRWTGWAHTLEEAMAICDQAIRGTDDGYVIYAFYGTGDGDFCAYYDADELLRIYDHTKFKGYYDRAKHYEKSYREAAEAGDNNTLYKIEEKTGLTGYFTQKQPLNSDVDDGYDFKGFYPDYAEAMSIIGLRRCQKYGLFTLDDSWCDCVPYDSTAFDDEED